MIKSAHEIDFKMTDMTISTANNGLKIVFNKYNQFSPVFEQTGLKGQLEIQNYSATKSGANMTFIFKKQTKEKWNQLFGRTKSAEVKTKKTNIDFDPNQSGQIANKYLEAEKPRLLNSVLDEKNITSQKL